MKTYIRRLMNMFESVDTFGKKPELTLTAKLTALFALVAIRLTALRNSAASQTGGTGEMLEGVAGRRALITEIYGTLRDIREIAKGLEQEEGNVGLSENFRLPELRSYANIAASARSFVLNATPLQADFVESGMPATFIADLQAKITAFDAASGTKVEGLTDQVGSTASLEFHADAGLKIVQQLRGIMRVHLRPTPDLLAGWISASRVERSAPADEVTEPPPADPGSGSGTPGA
jgi:hypothetical protein